GKAQKNELAKIKLAVEYATKLGIECHAGHGLNYQTTKMIAKIPDIYELNIGHFIIGEAIFEGLAGVIKKMRKILS
ncbi:MAG: pyridoxine 5'-phosphate synthase, partial [Alphaproteobacteria bacterium]